MSADPDVSAQLRSVVLEDMRRWLEHAVIGLNLCPFAKSVHVKGQIHWVVTDAQDARSLLPVLRQELLDLVATDPDRRDTTLLMAPQCLGDFLDFNDFLGEADALLAELGLQGELQIASFHPLFQFAGTDVDDIGNYTNRAPYPTLHLLREASIDRAVQAYPQAEVIYERNMQVLAQLGHAGWQALGLQPTVPLRRSDRSQEQR
jgi:uncharacterized protein